MSFNAKKYYIFVLNAKKHLNKHKYEHCYALDVDKTVFSCSCLEEYCQRTLYGNAAKESALRFSDLRNIDEQNLSTNEVRNTLYNLIKIKETKENSVVFNHKQCYN